MKNKKSIVILVMLVIAAIFMIGTDWASKSTHRLFHSYYADTAIPFGYYFLLILLEDKFEALKKWYVKAISVFTLCALSETLQYFGIYALASVFDPMDFVAYAAGALLAAFFDRILFKRSITFWH